MNHTRCALVAPIAALLLVAAACGGTDEVGPAPTPAPTTAATTTEAPAPTTAATTTEAPATTTTEAPIILTDSFRGVTAEAILVGWPAIDFDDLNRTFGLDLHYANYGPVIEIVVADLNGRGGILGRRVEVTVRPFIPVGAVTADAVCVELTQDIGVFAVLDGFAGPGAEGVNECFTSTYDTILVGGQPSTEQLERATAPWITPDISLTRRGRAFVNLLREAGRLDDLGVFMLYGANSEYEPVMVDTRSALEAEGVEVPILVTNQSTGDEMATIAQLEVLLERARTEGVSSILQFGEAVYAQEYIFSLGDEFNLLILNGDSASRWSSEPPPGVDDAGLILSNKDVASSGDPTLADCIGLVETGLGITLKTPEELDDAETNYWAAMSNVCSHLALFELVATAAGPDLTNRSFAAAAASLGDVSLPGYPFASLGPDKPDARDSLTLVRWNSDSGEWEAISEPTDVG